MLKAYDDMSVVVVKSKEATCTAHLESRVTSRDNDDIINERRTLPFYLAYEGGHPQLVSAQYCPHRGFDGLVYYSALTIG